jgi:uncharacterized integral membrane protein
LLRKTVAALILVPLAIVIIVFAVANRQSVTVSLDPFNAGSPAVAVALPLFALIILAVIAGVIVGGAAAWFGQRRWRRRVRILEREADELRGKLAALQGAEPAASIIPREQTPPQRLKLKPPAQ